MRHVQSSSTQPVQIWTAARNRAHARAPLFLRKSTLFFFFFALAFYSLPCCVHIYIHTQTERAESREAFALYFHSAIPVKAAAATAQVVDSSRDRSRGPFLCIYLSFFLLFWCAVEVCKLYSELVFYERE